MNIQTMETRPHSRIPLTTKHRPLTLGPHFCPPYSSGFGSPRLSIDLPSKNTDPTRRIATPHAPLWTDVHFVSYLLPAPPWAPLDFSSPTP